MEFPLTVTSIIETDNQGVDRRSDATAVMAESDLGPLSAYGSPEFFFGRLLDASDEQISYLRFAPGVRVGFRDHEYWFEKLERSGTFKLVRSKK
jgi:hypothetical protein